MRGKATCCVVLIGVIGEGALKMSSGRVDVMF